MEIIGIFGQNDGGEDEGKREVHYYGVEHLYNGEFDTSLKWTYIGSASWVAGDCWVAKVAGGSGVCSQIKTHMLHAIIPLRHYVLEFDIYGGGSLIFADISGGVAYFGAALYGGGHNVVHFVAPADCGLNGVYVHMYQVGEEFELDNLSLKEEV